MVKQAGQLKELAATLRLRDKGPHEQLRKLVVDGFFDVPKKTNQIVAEVLQTSGKRIQSNVIQTYMKKFMSQGIIRVLRSEQHPGNYWILASENEVRAAQTTLQSGNGEQINALPPKRDEELPGDSHMPLHHFSNTTKTKILFLAANPKGTSQLALDQECREIENKIGSSKYRDSFEFITKWAVRTDDLLQYMHQHRAHIIHFSGHGSNSEELIFLNSSNQAKSVSKKALKQLFATLKGNIRVVVLNACFSRPQAEAITEIIDCAIGMNREIGDNAAVKFAAAFYQALGFGRSVQEAFDSGKTQLMLDDIPEETTPALLIRKGVDPQNIFLTTSNNS